LDPEDDPQRTPGRRRRPLSREVVWTVILALVWARACAATRHTFALIFGGWVIGMALGDDRTGGVSPAEDTPA
jgi:hypothetical protein